MDHVLIGVIAATSFAVGLFFFRFWRSTADTFFLLFALSFWIEGLNRVVLYEFVGPDEDAPLYYLIRVVAYGLIIAAIVLKNRGPRRRE